MPNLSIKDVPEAWAQALRARAARNHRSLQGELMALIQSAVATETSADISVHAGDGGVSDNITRRLTTSAPGQAGQRGSVVGTDRFGRPIIRRGWKTVEQIAAELRVEPSDPAVCRDLPRGVDIIREERDAR
jgi:plasmid stability protein